MIRYHELIDQTDNHDEKWMNQITALQEQIEQLDGWKIQQRIERVIHDLSLPADTKVVDLSGGWSRRVALGAASFKNPIFCSSMSPPTIWISKRSLGLKKCCLGYPKTLIFITHDRALLRKLATRIIEIDRGKITSYPPDYDGTWSVKNKLRWKKNAQRLFDKKLSEEEVWIDKALKPDAPAMKAAFEHSKPLREERQLRRTIKDKPNLKRIKSFNPAKWSSKRKTLFWLYPQSFIIKDFSFNIQRGDKIAIVGANGAGKTTLIKLLVGQLTPLTGEVKQSPKNQVAFFDQARMQLDPTLKLMENVAEGDDFIEISGKQKHVIGYLGEFLFSPKKCRTLGQNSFGGETKSTHAGKIIFKTSQHIRTR